MFGKQSILGLLNLGWGKISRYQAFASSSPLAILNSYTNRDRFSLLEAMPRASETDCFLLRSSRVRLESHVLWLASLPFCALHFFISSSFSFTFEWPGVQSDRQNTKFKTGTESEWTSGGWHITQGCNLFSLTLSPGSLKVFPWIKSGGWVPVRAGDPQQRLADRCMLPWMRFAFSRPFCDHSPLTIPTTFPSQLKQ